MDAVHGYIDVVEEVRVERRLVEAEEVLLVALSQCCFLGLAALGLADCVTNCTREVDEQSEMMLAEALRLRL